MLPLLTEAVQMTIKKNSSNAKKSKKVAGKRHAKFTVPTGENVSSMKLGLSIIKHMDKASPVLQP
jgi:hypothetical protein